MASAPDPPPTPDPYKTAAAQTAANVSVAIANTVLQNADEDRPDATVSYVQFATYTVNDPQYDSNGNQVGTTERVIPRFKKVTRFNDTAQAAYDQQQQVALISNTYALNQLSRLNELLTSPLSLAALQTRKPIPDAPTLQVQMGTPDAIVSAIGSQDLTAHVQSVQDAILARLQYQYDLDRDSLLARLANQGVFVGSEAYDRELLALDKKQTDGRLQAFLAALQDQTRIIQLQATIGQFANQAQEQKFRQQLTIVTTQNAEQIRQFQALIEAAQFVNTIRQQQLQEFVVERNQPMNETSALLHGGQIQVPQFQAYRSGQIANTPLAESVYRAAEITNSQYQFRVQQQNQLIGGILGLAGKIGSAAILA